MGKVLSGELYCTFVSSFHGAHKIESHYKIIYNYLSPQSPYLSYCILVDSSTVICWMSPFVILGVSDLFCHFYSIFDGKFCWHTV